MAWFSKIVNGRGARYLAKVTSRGQLVTAPIEFNETIFRSMVTPAIAYNFVSPMAGKRFVIDGIIFSGDKNVSSTNGAVITIYEAASANDTVSLNTIFTLDVGRIDKGSLSGLNVITNEGVWLNGTTDDATTNVTIFGYFVDA